VVTLALLLIGELAPGLLPLRVTLEVSNGQVVIDADGSQHKFPAPTNSAWAHVQFTQPRPEDREFQIDGSDVTARKDRDPDQVRAWTGTLYYQFAAWLRDEGSFSRWEDVRLFDLANGTLVAEGREAVEAAGLPPAFRLEARLRGPEALAQIDLTTGDPVFHGIVEINRDTRSVRWLTGPEGHKQEGAWYFPEQPAPFAAELLQLVGRAAAAGYALLVGAGLIAWLLSRLPVLPRLAERLTPGPRTGRLLLVLVGGVWLAAAAWVTVRLYHQLPHIVDAAAYHFEMGVLRSGRLWFQPPPLSQFFKYYFETTDNGRWFAQYPPGAPAVYALGSLVGLEWLMGPLTSLALIFASAFAARQFFSSQTAAVVLCLGAISPFILFQAGAFMSHPVAGATLAGALAAFAYAQRTRRTKWYLGTGALLGWGLLTRELSTVLFALPLVAWLAGQRRWRGLALLLAAGLPFAVAYLLYNAQLTGDPLLLPRNAVDGSDRYGFGTFGDTHHTLAAGLVYTDENLTILQFDLFGWLPLFSLTLLGLPFLLGHAKRYDWLLGGALLVYIAGYVGVPGAGIVLGPRYYYEALPFILLLAARGVDSLVSTCHSLGVPRVAAQCGVLAVVGLLTFNTVLFYYPHLVERRTDYFAIDHNWGVSIPFVTTSLLGPRLTGFDGPTLVLVPDDVVYKTLSALNCPFLDSDHIQSCQVLFVWAGHDQEPQLVQAYPGRAVLTAQLQNNVVVLKPFS
jgi:hypothetical protein